MRKPVLYLHIGTPKTGTSTIQLQFALQQKTLLQHGVLYPEAGLRSETHVDLAGAACRTARGKATPEDAAMLASLRAEIERHRLPKVVISSEHISDERCLMIDMVAPTNTDFLSLFEAVYVVIYFRRIDKYCMSKGIQEVVRSSRYPYYPSLATAALEFADYPLRAILDTLAGHVGKEHLIVRPFEKAQLHKQDLMADFCRIVGLDGLEETVFAQWTLNQGTTVEMADLARIVNGAKDILSTDFIDNLRELIEQYSEIQMRAGEHGQEILDPARRRELLARYAEDYAHIARTYLGREDGKLFREAPPPADGEAFEGISLETTIQFLLGITQSQQGTINELDQRLKRLGG